MTLMTNEMEDSDAVYFVESVYAVFSTPPELLPCIMWNIIILNIPEDRYGSFFKYDNPFTEPSLHDDGLVYRLYISK